MPNKHNPCDESLCVSSGLRSGAFSCIRNYIIFICISDPQTTILGGPDIYFKEGSTMNITCLVKDSPEPPQFIFWYHQEQVGYSSL